MIVTMYEDLVTLGEESCRRFAGRPFLGEKIDGRWVWIRYDEFQRRVDQLRGGLATLGIGPGDVVAIVSPNKVAWAVAAYASYGLGAVFVPMYGEQRAEEWRDILADCGARLVFAGTPAITEKLQALRSELPALQHLVEVGEGDAALMRVGHERPTPSRRPAPDELATMIYTSGTTGRPKGVELTHRNLASNVAATVATFPIAPEDRTLSFLPWAHVYGQVVELHILMAVGASTALNDGLPNLPANLREVRPTVLVAVPRIFTRLHAQVRDDLARRPRFIRALFDAGVRNVLRRNRGESLTLRERMVTWLADHLLFAKVRRRLGGRIRYAITASAALSTEVAALIDAIGIPVYEGYGLTETSPVVSTNRPGARRMGTVGQPVPDVRVAIERPPGMTEGDGEIVVYGPNVMRGYHGRPADTAAVMTPDGGLRTGDLGHLDPDGYLCVTGRIKEQYKLENGKYVMPSPLEQRLAMSPYVKNVMLYGADRPFNVAVVVIDPDAIGRWASAQGIVPGDDLAHDLQVQRMIADEMERMSPEFRAYERPRGLVLTTRDFAIEDGTLTPSMKLRRKAVFEQYADAITGVYRDAAPVLAA